MSLRLAIVASGNGSNAQAIIDAARREALDAEICLVISNKPGAGVLERAQRVGVPHTYLDHRAYREREQFDIALAERIREAGADTVALAGYMRLLTPVFLQQFPGRVVNIHPSLLPAFPGVRARAEAQTWGVKLAGCTVHFVEEAMDSGAVIIQAAVPCLAGEPLDDLLVRIHAMEHRVYPQALQWLASDRLVVEGRQVFLKENPIRVLGTGNTEEQEKPSSFDALVWPPLEPGF